MGSSGGGSGPTAQQQQLEAQQIQTQATLDQTENDRRKRLLLAMQGTRVFRGSALSTAAGANTAAAGNASAGPSANQQAPVINATGGSLIAGAGINGRGTPGAPNPR